MAYNIFASTLFGLVMTLWHEATASQHVEELCGQIAPSRVGDVRWSGNPSAASENVYYYGTPYNPSKQEHLSVAADDYFMLLKKAGRNYQLKLYSHNGTLKEEFPDGKVKANSDVIFYIIDGWFGIVIAKEDHHEGDLATFSNLQVNPPASMLEGACVLQEVQGLCGKISASRVGDVQWSGRSSSTYEHVWYQGTPYTPSTGRLSVAPDDYFILSKKTDADYQLKQYGSDGTLKSILPDGKVKANSDAVFYIVEGTTMAYFDGRFATVITKEDHHQGDSASFSNLKMNLSESLLEGTCMLEEGQSVCRKIPSDRVSNAQWSGKSTATTEWVFFSGAPYDPNHHHHVSVDMDDYYTLSKLNSTDYQLKQYGSDGTLKSSLPPGKLKANSDLILYIVNDWYGTSITKKKHHPGEEAFYDHLQINPSESLVGGACMFEEVEGLCGKIYNDRVCDIRWSGKVSQNYEYPRCSGNPYILSPYRHHVSVDVDDYYTLSRITNSEFKLKMYQSNGSLKHEFPCGKVKANSVAVFYIIDDWYGTLITKSSGRELVYRNLQTNPSQSLVEGSCLVSTITALSIASTPIFTTGNRILIFCTSTIVTLMISVFMLRVYRNIRVCKAGVEPLLMVA